MASKFRFHLLTGTDPAAQYNAITTKDPYCFYLLGNGTGYLGEKLLFGSGTGGLENSGVVVMNGGTLADPVADSLYILKDTTFGENVLSGVYQYDGTNMVSFTDAGVKAYIDSILMKEFPETLSESDYEKLPTVKAVNDLISAKIGDADIANAKFFRFVESHIITQEDLNNANISKPAGTAVGDVGLLFTADNNESDDGDEKFFFINLKDYLSTTIKVIEGAGISVTEADGENGAKNITVALKTHSGEKAILTDTNGVYLHRFDTDNYNVNDGDGTEEYGPEPDPDKLVTEKAMVRYVQDKVLTAVSQAIDEALSDVVTWSEDPPQTTGA